MMRTKNPLIRSSYGIAERRQITPDEWQDIWPGPDLLIPFAEEPQELELVAGVGGEANTADGTGVQAVRLWLLDPDFMLVSHVVETAGLTSAPIPGGPYMRQNGINAVRAGSTGKTEGAPIDLREVDTGLVWGRMQVGANRGRTGAATIPANMTGALINISLDLYQKKQGDEIDLEFLERPFGECWVDFSSPLLDAEHGTFTNIGNPEHRFQPKTDIRVSMLPSGTPTRVSGNFSSNFYPA